MLEEQFEKLQEAYLKTIRGNMEDKYRVGDLIEFPEDGDVIIMGDLHGNRHNFRKVVKAANLAENPKRHLIVQEATHTWEVTEDRSFLLHEEIAFLKSEFPDQVHIILGNHELSELTGKEILKGGICYNILFREGMKKNYGPYYDKVKELFDDYIRTMPLACRAKNGIFICHSTPPQKYIPHYTLSFFRKGSGSQKKDKVLAENLVWGRDLSQEAADAFAKNVKSKIIIVGHTACKQGFQVPNSRHIILDSKGLYATSLHFRLDKKYNQKGLVKNIQHLNKKEIKAFQEKQAEKA